MVYTKINLDARHKNVVFEGSLGLKCISIYKLMICEHVLYERAGISEEHIVSPSIHISFHHSGEMAKLRDILIWIPCSCGLTNQRAAFCHVTCSQPITEQYSDPMWL